MAAACGACLVPGAAPASAGGATAVSPAGGVGGTEYGSAIDSKVRPVATRFRVTPAKVVAGRALPKLLLRVDEPGVPEVRARIVVWPTAKRGQVVRLDLGRIQTGRVLRPSWPRGTTLAAGRYVVRVHATDPAGKALVRRRAATGRTTLVVAAPPAPPKKAEPVPPPPPPVLAPVDPSVSSKGTFPVAGPYTWGDGVGADRGDHAHEGVDLLGAAGTPIVAPLGGTVRFTKHQAGGAGEYVVLRAGDGRDMFFAHCLRGSTAVVAGQVVAQGAELCKMGSTGSSSANHLHFELWPNGWRTGEADSRPADPAPQLRAWER